MAKALTKRQTLTFPKINSLKTTGKRYEIRDTEIGGLCVRVSEKGVKTFVLKKRYPGSDNPTRRALGEVGVLTLEEAREKARQWVKLIKQGIDPSEVERLAREAEAQKRKNTFAAAVEDFIADKVSKERRGRVVEQEIRREFLPAWGDRPIYEITPKEIAALIRTKARHAPPQARNLLALLKRFFKWAVQQQCYDLDRSPASDLSPRGLVGEKEDRTRILNEDEVRALWRTASRMRYPHSAVYKLLLLSGLRLNEVADAAWSEVGESIWTIPAERMKARNSRARAHEVPLTKEIAEVFAAVPKIIKAKFVFSTTLGASPVWMGARVKARLDTRMLRSLRAIARLRGEDPSEVKLPPFVNHDIRRTVRSQLSQIRQISEEAREAVLAHVRPGIKKTYDIHHYRDEKREALELWAARLRGIIEPKPANVIQLQTARA